MRLVPTVVHLVPTVVHLVVGPDQHGVVRHALSVADELGHPVVRAERPDQVPPDALAGFDVVHLPYTDRLLAERCEDSATAYEQLTAPLLAAGQALSVTLHDLPVGDSELQTRRRAAYRRVVATARGVVVQSRVELARLEDMGEQARSVRRIPLPVAVQPTPLGVRPGDEVVVLGFLFPDRGYEHTIAELPAGVALLALGGASRGHEDLPAQLAQLATDRGRQLHATGFVSDAELPAHLAAAGIPVAPNRRVAASASIATWLAHGRRPLVPDSPYARELDQDWPGTVTRYDPDVPGDLARAIERAQADPSLTRLAPGTVPGLSLPEVAAAYGEHFWACAPDTRIAVGRHWVVPDNRWDLLDGLEPEPPTVSVVIPYFQAQAELDLVLTGLTTQTHPHARLQVVVADDGSATAPDLGAAEGLSIQCVRQDDLGFRAAAARNLGAAAADGEVLLFLDGDTIPEPDYVRHLARLPALAPDALTVGRRRHADLTGWSPERVAGWLQGRGEAPTELDEPGWLVDGYRDSADLRQADERSYRYVISAVLGLSRALFDELGGFDPQFTSYGGEDWELTHRAYAAGALLAHVGDAVAWHSGPDWAGRDARVPGAKNAETLALTRLVPDPVARGGGQWLPYPAVVITLAETDPAAVLATARSAFASGADCGFWVPDASALGDPRIRSGPVPTDVSARALVHVDLHAPAALHQLPDLVTATLRRGRLTTPVGRFTATRARRRSIRWAGALGLEPDALAARLFGGNERSAPVSTAPVDLAHELKQVHQTRR